MTRALILALLVCVSVSVAVRVTLFRERNFTSGNKNSWSADISGQQCQRVADDDKKKAQSIQIDQGACVILFEKNDCTGRGVVVGQNVNWCNPSDLKSCDFKKKTQSVRLC